MGNQQATWDAGMLTMPSRTKNYGNKVRLWRQRALTLSSVFSSLMSLWLMPRLWKYSIVNTSCWRNHLTNADTQGTTHQTRDGNTASHVCKDQAPATERSNMP
jgi:hypothetical protein